MRALVNDMRRRLASRLAGSIREATVTASSASEASAALAGLRQPLCGTYVGGGRVLLYLETGGRLFISSDDRTLVAELLQHGIYDKPFTRFLHRELAPDDTFVDVGANVGLFTIIGGYVAWRGRTIAYEAAPALQQVIRENVAANWFSDRVILRPVAAGSCKGTRRFGFPRQMQLLGGLDLDPDRFAEDYPGVDVEVFDVDVVRLDEDLAAHDDIALVKIDVEGGEADVLAGMRGLVDRGAVRTVSLEVRRDAHERNRDGAGWNELVAELRYLAGLGARFSVPDEDGVDHAVGLDEVEQTALYSNLIVRLVPR